MKKITTLIVLAFAGINFSSAQTHFLYGTCYSGGASSWGTIFQADLDGSNLQTVYSFLNPEGAMPWGKIAQAPNGKIYGVTFLGGCADSCTLYEYDPIAHSCIDVYDFFCNTPVSEPSQNGLIISHDGNLYGLEQSGILYKFNPNTHVYTLLNQTVGAVYYGGIMQTNDGTLYGVSYNGGTNTQGSIFSYDLIAQTYTVLYSFDGTHGAHPYYENLIQASNGKLYGTTYGGGANSQGVIFSYDLTTNVYTDLYDFGTDGNSPMSGLMQATNGKLYGMTYQGGTSNNGVIFSYDISASQYSVVYNFDFTNGSHPQRGLSEASNGKLFGATYGGGANSVGVAFSYDIATSTFTKLTDFSTATGSYPQCDMQEMILAVETGITSANASPVSIYVDASNQLVVRSSGLGENSEVAVYDGLGKNVFQSKIVNQKSEFDLSSYPRGIYFVQLKSGAEISTQKIVLAK